MTYEEQHRVGSAMVSHGGSFVEALGRALLLADTTNRERIKAAFPEYWETYTKIADHLSEMAAEHKEVDADA